MTTYTLPYTGEQISTRLAAVTNHDHTLSDITDIVLPGSASVYLNGNGAWTTPTASGSVFKPGIYIGRTGSGADYICDGDRDEVQFNQALAAAVSGTTIYVLPGHYYIAARIFQQYKSLNIIGIGDVTITKQVAPGSANGIYLEGRIIATNLTVSTAAKGASVITVSSGALIHPGDIIKIWKAVQWCPADYPDQYTGEMYCVKSVSGNDVALTENLIREYNSSDTVKINVYRPIEVHIENIKIQDYDSAEIHEGISLRYCINSSVSDCWVKDSGLAGISFYSSYNVKLYNNKVYNNILPGSGYGIGLWSGIAHAEVFSNHLENSRHCITCNTDERNSLLRGINIHHNTMIPSPTNDSSFAVDTHNQVIDIRVENNNIIIPEGAHGGFWDGSYNSVFCDNTISGGFVSHYAAAIERRGSVDGGMHVIKNNYMEGGNAAYFYRAGYFANDENLVFIGNTVNGCNYGISFIDDAYRSEAFKSLIIQKNQFKAVNSNAIALILNGDGSDIIIQDNYINGTKYDAITINATNNTVSTGDNTHVASTQTPDTVTISGNTIVNPNTANSTYTGILITDISNALLENNFVNDMNGYGGSAIKTAGTSNYNVLIGNVAKGMTGTKFSLTGANNFPATANVETLNHSF